MFAILAATTIPRARFRPRLGPTPCCRRRSSTTRKAKRFGATSATSTGRARKRLSCLPKPAPARQKAEQPPVDRGQAERDQAEAGEILRRQRLAEEQAAEQDRDRRHEQGDEQRIGRARRLDEPEIEHIAE